MTTWRNNEVSELTIASLVYGGDAIAHLPDGRALFVPFALPGELVSVRLVEEKRGYARAELVDVLEPATMRITPRCRHFSLCGGCHYQHIDYQTQLTVKSKILHDQLERIGGLKDIPLQQAVPSPEAWQYRNHIQFHLTPSGKLGFQSMRTNQPFPVEECYLPNPDLSVIWPQLDLEVLPGLERVSLRQGAEGEIMLILESEDPQPLEFEVEGLSLSAVHLGPRGALVLAGSEFLAMEVAGRAFRVSPNSFFQVNIGLVSAMITHVLANLPVDTNQTILDVYCGVGLFSAFLAPRAKRLVGIETSSTACEDFSANLDDFDHVELYEAPAENVLRSVDFHPDIILVDPPRAGLGKATLEGVLRQRAHRLVYVSCDPATLARDARRLTEGGYHLKQITPFDMFPQTYHIESISFWEM